MKKKIKLVVLDMNPDVDYYILEIRVKLHQLLYYLLENAIKYF